MPVDNVNLLEYIVDVPDFNASIYTRSYDTVPIANGERLELDYPREMGIENLDQFASLQTPDVQIFSRNELILQESSASVR